MSKLIKWGLVVLVVWWVIHDPTAAGHAAGKLGDFLTHAAASLTTAISSI